jgi:hypothetical protein
MRKLEIVRNRVPTGVLREIEFILDKNDFYTNLTFITVLNECGLGLAVQCLKSLPKSASEKLHRLAFRFVAKGIEVHLTEDSRSLLRLVDRALLCKSNRSEWEKIAHTAREKSTIFYKERGRCREAYEVAVCNNDVAAENINKRCSELLVQEEIYLAILTISQLDLKDKMLELVCYHTRNLADKVVLKELFFQFLRR